ncbi:MAG: hypothetical protein JJLCMIEE_00751 [Acidimicrobiales bacterium]|nr:MAG: hypothetical protein EDR02_02765 [Actinomycetota bacterium]MBV6507696.1 hypothetical protein [Acidimicrobiales bacterium]RIK07622.1 MAG: hypothetical protein DCC48_03775 [Acidobacteriota bacterium]
MRARALLVVCAVHALSTVVLSPASAQDLPEPPIGQEPYGIPVDPGEVEQGVAYTGDGVAEQIVSFDEAASPAEQQAALAGVEIVEHLPEIDAYVVQAGASQQAALSADADVEAVEPDGLLQLETNDPYQYLQPNLDQIGWETAFNQCCTIGSPPTGAPVAVLDSGIDSDADDLQAAGRVPICRSYVGGNCRQDDIGHGTAVAAVIAADTNNAVGIAGISPNSPIYGYQVCDDYGCPMSQVASALIRAANDGAKVINMSFGGYGYSTAIRDAVRYAMSEDLVIVASTGNEGLNTSSHYPSGFEDVLGVAAVTTGTTSRASFSNYGPDTDLTAPGTEIVVPYWPKAGADDWAYADGTSFSGPHVSGVAALLRSTYPSMSAEEVRGRLLTGATDIGSAGWDQQHGFGLLSAPAALNKSFPSDSDMDGDGFADSLDGAPHDPSTWPVLDISARQKTPNFTSNGYQAAPGVFVFAYLDRARLVASVFRSSDLRGTNWNSAYARVRAYEFNLATRGVSQRVLYLSLVDGQGAPDHLTVNLRTTDNRAVSKFTVTTSSGVGVSTSNT